MNQLIFHKGEYLKKINTLFLLFVIPIMMISIVSYIYIRSTLVQELEQYNTGIVNSAGLTLESELNELRSLGVQFVHNTRTSRILDAQQDMEYSSENISRIQNIMESLISIRTEKNYIDSILFYIPGNGMLITDDGIIGFKNYFELYNVYEKYSAAFWKNICNLEEHPEILPVTKVHNAFSQPGGKDTDIIPFIVYIDDYSVKSVLIINLKENYLSGILTNYMTDPHNEMFLINPSGTILAHTNHAKLYDMDAEYSQTLTGKLNGQETDAFNIQLNRTKTKAFIRKIEHIGYYVAYTINDKLFYRKANLVLQTLVILNLFILAGSVILTRIFSRMLYSPINNLLRKSKIASDNNKIQIDEIEYLGEKLDKYRELKGYARERLIENLICHNPGPADEVCELLEDDEIGLKGPYFVVSVFYVSYCGSFAGSFSAQEQDTIKKGLYELVRDFVTTEFAGGVFVEMDSSIFYCVINLQTPQQREKYIGVLREADKILRNDSAYFTIYVVTSNVINSVGKIPERFWEVYEALDYIDLDHDNISLIEDIDYDDNPLRIPADFEKRLSNVVLADDKKSIRRLVEELFNTNLSYAKSLGRLRELSSKLYDINNRIIQNYHVGLEYIDKEEKDQILKNPGFDKNKEYFIDLFSKIATHLNKGSNNKKEMFEKYISEHYMLENMCLEKMANDLNLNTKYLSRAFKEQTGKTFSKYLTDYRIEIMKQLLLELDMTVEEAGLRIGISSRSTLNRIFKKAEGIPPAAYRYIRQKNKQDK